MPSRATPAFSVAKSQPNDAKCNAQIPFPPLWLRVLQNMSGCGSLSCRSREPAGRKAGLEQGLGGFPAEVSLDAKPAASNDLQVAFHGGIVRIQRLCSLRFVPTGSGREQVQCLQTR